MPFLTRLFLLVCLFSLVTSTCLADAAFTQQPDVQKFIKSMVKEHGFKKTELDTLFSSVKMRPKIIQQFKAPLEEQPWYLYERLFVNEWRIQQGLIFWRKNAQSLALAEKKYGVPASIIVATLGIETKYGQRIGEHRVLDALCNLAFIKSKRAPFFRHELEEFLLLSRENHLDPNRVMGSYAGAIGQPQFMPSSYRYFAVNFAGKGKVDLINNTNDAISSIGNYYKEHGWQANQPVAVPAALLGNVNQFTAKKTLTSSDLAKYGIVNGGEYQSQKIFAVKLIELKDYRDKQYWLGFHNFSVIKRYNPSDLYAMAVFQLSHHLSTLKGKS
ncbi:MAG: lytic murein transglycosylase B [Gammaproteobacteria bacterium RIFCSPHIGHO2_12_FULL_42_13]|nr:MAG: lytic murein transglycosylase B [Gammaproteobacteria bacterium RIFCSPHIGHO2_12_FULL_42_13]